MSGVCYVKSGGSWTDMNFTSGHSIWVKDGGVWEELTQAGSRKMYVKKSGTWEQVYPSLTETWTTANLPTASAQGSYSASDYAFNGSYPYTNITSAATAVKWTGQVSTVSQRFGRELKGNTFGWSPSSTAGFDYGAIQRIEVTTAQSRIDPSNYPTTVLNVKPTNGTAKSVTLDSIYDTLTFDYTVTEWGLDPDEAASLHDSPFFYIELYPETDPYVTSVVCNFTVEDVKSRIEYKHN